MRARAVALAALASVSIVGIGWQLGSQAIDASQSLTAATGTGTGAATAASAATDAAAQAAATAKAAADAAATAQAQADAANTAASTKAAADAAAVATAAADAAAAANAVAATAATASSQSGSFTGSVVATQFGNMQVSVTIANGAITEVTPLQLTNRGGRSVAISNQAAPILRSEVLAAQSASVQNVSGATYTTQGYLRSLQSALDMAGF
ncbi:FMN-binding domain-containing protein [Cryobacterium flavum]|uniref:FMN-binding domain-containing protein n=2 Tax=Cryobacterium flavum TaxID=1424659 RepID=A0A5E9FUY2_9MICO|nr:FMN-binding protein [Cryobacterium flavum]SDM81689.1 FMN-binding domain-containing protein [Cryobacterium flavum]